MEVYIISFIISIVSMYLMSRTNYTIIKYFFLSIPIILLSSIAGMRDINVGTDVQVYVLQLFSSAVQSNSVSEYWNSEWLYIYKYVNVSDYEPGFVLLVYIATKLTGSLQWVLFTVQLVTILPITITLYKMRTQITPWIGMAVYCFMFYNMTLNMMRQWVAMAIVFYGMNYLLKNNKTKYLLTILLATLFHQTALLVGILTIVVYVWIKKVNVEKCKLRIRSLTGKEIQVHERFIRFIIVIILAIIIIFNLPLMKMLLNVVGMSQYAVYFSGNINLSINQLAIRLPLLLLLLIYYRENYRNFTYVYLCLMVGLEAVIGQLTTVYVYAFRISVWLAMFNILAFAMIDTLEEKKHRKLLIRGIILGYVASYWLYYYYTLNVHDTLPYVFAR